MNLKNWFAFIVLIVIVRRSSGFYENIFPTFLNDNNPFVSVLRENVFRYFSEQYNNFTLLRKYDFVIVGAGPAGCVLANRLSADPSVSVLLLEVGNPELSIMTDVMLGSPNLQSTSFNWGYETEPQRRACLSMRGERCQWPHGRGLGGSSIINYMIYTRGNRRDFDRWCAAGNKGWCYEDVLPYFIKSESNNLEGLQDSIYHGQHGPLNVEDIPWRSNISHAFVKSAQEYGMNLVDYNGPEQIGVSYLQSNTQNGWRFTAAESYLHPIKDRKNLHISPKSWVTKLVFDPTDPKKIDGVLFVKNRKEYFVRAKKEVILSAGAFETPKLLMLSGIGPEEDLKELDVEVMKDLPVGKTLFEHMGVFGPIYLAHNLSDGMINIEDVVTPNVIAQWYSGMGPLTTNGIEALAYIKTNVSDDPDPGMPDIELMQAMATVGFDTAPGTRNGLGLTSKAFDAVFGPLGDKRAFLFLPMLLHPKSSGYLKLKSKNPYSRPHFYPNFYENSHDLKTQLAGIRIAQEIARQDSFKPLGLEPYQAVVPGCEEFQFDSDEYWECYIMHLSSTLHHQVGTCKMGPSSDKTTVVNSQLLVHGMENLRVVDISIIPSPPSGHTAAFSFMIGEKAADMIKDHWKYNDDKHNMVRKRSIHRYRREYDWQKVEHHSRRNLTRPTVEDLKRVLKPHDDELKKHLNVSAVEVLSEVNPSVSEDMIRMVTLKNGTRYGKGQAKPRNITAELHKMNATEYKKEDFIVIEAENTMEKGNMTRHKRFIGFGSAGAGEPDMSRGDYPVFNGFKQFLNHSWKSVNNGMFKIAEFTRSFLFNDYKPAEP